MARAGSVALPLTNEWEREEEEGKETTEQKAIKIAAAAAACRSISLVLAKPKNTYYRSEFSFRRRTWETKVSSSGQKLLEAG